MDITETADVLGEKVEWGKHLGKMILVPETSFKMKGPGEGTEGHPKVFSGGPTLQRPI